MESRNNLRQLVICFKIRQAFSALISNVLRLSHEDTLREHSGFF